MFTPPLPSPQSFIIYYNLFVVPPPTPYFDYVIYEQPLRGNSDLSYGLFCRKVCSGALPHPPTLIDANLGKNHLIDFQLYAMFP